MSDGSPEIEIRPLDEAYFETILGIAEILEDAPHWSREQYEEILSGGELPPDSPHRKRIGLVAHELRSQEVLGFVVASLVAPEAELESIAVAAHAQRRGVGRSLLEALTTKLRLAGIEDLLLEVRATNVAAIGFYRAQNFKQIGVRPRYYADPEGDAVLMRLRLG